MFRDLVGLLLFELRRDMGLGLALVGALLRFLLAFAVPAFGRLRASVGLRCSPFWLLGLAFLLGFRFSALF